MIPWIESHTYSIGPITLQTWGTLVAAGFLVGTMVAARRAKKMGLNPNEIWDLAFWIFISAMISSRLFHVLFYGLDYYIQHPLAAIDPREPGYAIMGGYLGAAAAFFWRVKSRGLHWMQYGDTLIWGLPWGCGIGRIGCFLIHDHPGTLTSFALGVQYPNGEVRHDHGLYLSLLGFATGALFLILDRKRRKPLFYFGMYLIVYGIVRFILDFYRIIDARWFGLTPTQWFLFGFVGLGTYFIFGRKFGTEHRT